MPDVPVHAVQRGHNKQPVFFDDQDYLEYLRCLKIAADDSACTVHAYVLMTNHIHLLLTPVHPESVGQLFQGVGRNYVSYINKTYQRRGSLWEGRYKASLIQTETYFLTCMRYVEMNPVRAKIVDHPAQYRWSSYAANALGISNAIIKPHEIYLRLGASLKERCDAYQGLFQERVDLDRLAAIRNGLRSGTPVGNARFKNQIESVAGRKIGKANLGRPALPFPKESDPYKK